MQLENGKSISVTSYSVFRSAEGHFQDQTTKIDYGAQTEEAKLHSFAQTIMQIAAMLAKAGVGVPAP